MRRARSRPASMSARLELECRLQYFWRSARCDGMESIGALNSSKPEATKERTANGANRHSKIAPAKIAAVRKAVYFRHSIFGKVSPKNRRK